MDMMEIRRQVLAYSLTGGKDMRLIYSGTISTAYTSTLNGLYTAEIKPHVTFGDYSKMYLCIFEGNTTTLSNALNALFFSAGVSPESFSSSTRNGGMLRGGYANVRSVDFTNDARVGVGTVLKIYTIDV